jgi:hypothetical protein
MVDEASARFLWAAMMMMMMMEEHCGDHSWEKLREEDSVKQTGECRTGRVVRDSLAGRKARWYTTSVPCQRRRHERVQQSPRAAVELTLCRGCASTARMCVAARITILTECRDGSVTVVSAWNCDGQSTGTRLVVVGESRRYKNRKGSAGAGRDTRQESPRRAEVAGQEQETGFD